LETSSTSRSRWRRTRIARRSAVLVRTAQQLQKKVRADGWSDALARLLSHRDVDGQWTALDLLLQALCAERVLAPDALVSELTALVEQGAAAGLDVFAVARLLAQAKPLDEDGRSTNRAALSARARGTGRCARRR
jgi:hypothetical protein